MTPIQPLITQLQAAEHGTPELTDAMAEALGWKWTPHLWRWVKGNTHKKLVDSHFTTDLNAILAEIERVFPKGLADFGIDFDGVTSAAIFARKFSVYGGAKHKSAPLAACIALLRAIEARDNGEVK